MPTKSRVALLFALMLLVGLLSRTVLADEPVGLTVYYSPKCDHCTLVREQVLAPLQAAYGDRLRVTYVDVTQAEGLSQLEATEARLGVKKDTLPVILSGNQLIASDDVFEIEDTLKGLLRDKLGAPSAGGSTSPAPEKTRSAGPASPGARGAAPIRVAYIQKDGCDGCARTIVVLEVLQKEYPSLVVSTFNNVRDAKLIEAMGQHLGLPQARRLIAPSVYVGKDALVDAEVTSGNLRALLDQYASTGAPAFWEGLSTDSGEQSILARFQSMGPWAVAVAAAIDGINPCAFATIIFFVWYLAVSARPRREMILVGLAFTLGVFATYYAVGMGAVGLLQLANRVHGLARAIYAVLAASCFLFAGFSLRDYVLARKGRFTDMTLRLPDPIRERIKGRIRRLTGAFAGVTFLSGAFIALLELACTGQVYLPTITFVVGVPHMRARALLYLLLYNIVFVIPLLAVLFLVVYGADPARFQNWLTRNTSKTKLVTAALFVLLGALLLTQVFAR